MLIYTHTRSKRKRSQSKRLALATEEHQAFLKSVGYHKPIRKLNRDWNMPDLKVEARGAPVSNNMAVNGGFKRSVDDWKWKRGREESDETIMEIERKKTRIAPIYSKGPVQYLTDDVDPTTLGRKV